MISPHVQVAVLVAITACLLLDASPLPDPDRDAREANGPAFVTRDKPDFPVADLIEEDKQIKTHVIGRMDDLEATTWISSLSELNFTFPPDMAESLELQDAVE